MQATSSKCDHCGAALAIEPGAVVRCKYCGTEHAPKDPGVTRAARSADTRAPVTVTFVNTGAAPVDLIWLDFEGVEKSYGGAAVGEARVFNTYVGHVWSVRRGGREVLRWAAYDQVPRRVELG